MALIHKFTLCPGANEFRAQDFQLATAGVTAFTAVSWRDEADCY